MIFIYKNVRKCTQIISAMLHRIDHSEETHIYLFILMIYYA